MFRRKVCWEKSVKSRWKNYSFIPLSFYQSLPFQVWCSIWIGPRFKATKTAIKEWKFWSCCKCCIFLWLINNKPRKKFLSNLSDFNEASKCSRLFIFFCFYDFACDPIGHLKKRWWKAFCEWKKFISNKTIRPTLLKLSTHSAMFGDFFGSFHAWFKYSLKWILRKVK